MCAAVPSVLVCAQERRPQDAEARAIFKELIEITTPEFVGSVKKAPEAQDERVEIQDFYDGVEFGYRFMKNVSGGK